LLRLFAAFGAGAALRCAPVIGLDDLQEVACVTSCEQGDGGGAGDGRATSGSSGPLTTGGASGGAGGAAGTPGSTTGTSGSSAAATGSGGRADGGVGAAGGAAGATGTSVGTTGGAAGAGGGARDAGSAGVAGAGGSIGGAGGTDAGSPLHEELIDAIDDDYVPHLILMSHGRNGYWFTVNDGSTGGTQSPPANNFHMSAGGFYSPFAAHLSGQGFTNWGIYMGFTLNKAPQGPKYTYDASSYRGVSFWAKLGPNNMCSPSSSCNILRFNISTRDTDPRGNVCSFCEDHFGVWVTLTPSWQKYVVMFSDFEQEGWGVPGPSSGLRFDTGHTYEVQFLVQPAGAPFDYWIDEVSFVLP
jgi:hypothetical protein